MKHLIVIIVFIFFVLPVYCQITIDAVNNFSFDTKSVNAINCEGIAERSNNSIKIIPNPTSGLFCMDIPAIDEQSSLQLLTSEGHLMKEMKIRKGENGKISVDLSGYSPGLYLLRIVNQSMIFFGKLIIIIP